jgi:hypothetical protein
MSFLSAPRSHLRELPQSNSRNCAVFCSSHRVPGSLLPNAAASRPALLGCLAACTTRMPRGLTADTGLSRSADIALHAGGQLRPPLGGHIVAHRSDEVESHGVPCDALAAAAGLVVGAVSPARRLRSSPRFTRLRCRSACHRISWLPCCRAGFGSSRPGGPPLAAGDHSLLAVIAIFGTRPCPWASSFRCPPTRPAPLGGNDDGCTHCPIVASHPCHHRDQIARSGSRDRSSPP